MISVFRLHTKMDRMYRSPKGSIYSSRFFDDLCIGYSYYLGEEGKENDFYTIEPSTCILSNLVFKQYRYDLSIRIEKVINRVAYGLMAYGKAYVLIKPDYIPREYCNSESREMSSIDICEVEGFVKKQDRYNYLFCIKGNNGTNKDVEIQRKQLITFDIKDLGYNRKHFTNIVKKLEKCDITSVSTSMLLNDSKVYDFNVHLKKSKLKELQVTKDIGWMSSVDELSESYILYKKMRTDKQRIKFLQYILEKLNYGLCNFIGDSGGKIVAHIEEKNYDQLWEDYSAGKLTVTELTDILYHN